MDIKVSMRIAFLSHEPLYPPTGGGSSEAGFLIQELVSRGHMVTCVGPVHSDCSEVELEARFGIQFIPFRVYPMGRYTALRTVKYLFYPIFLKYVFEKHRLQDKVDVIFTQHALSSVAGGWLSAQHHIPVVMNFLDFLTGFMESWPFWKMPPFLLAFIKKYETSLPEKYDAKHVFCVSNALKEKYLSQGLSPAKVDAFYFGFEASRFPFRTKKVDESDKAHFILIMHGSMDDHHIGDILLKSLRCLDAQLLSNQSVELRFVGKKTMPLRQFASKVESELVKISVKLRGFIPYSEISEELFKADIGIVPYESNAGAHCAFVAKAVEYAAVGIPVVCTKLAGTYDFFKESPTFTFTEFSGESFANGILKTIQNPVPQSQLRETSDRVHRELSWRNLVRNAVDKLEARFTTES